MTPAGPVQSAIQSRLAEALRARGIERVPVHRVPANECLPSLHAPGPLAALTARLRAAGEGAHDGDGLQTVRSGSQEPLMPASSSPMRELKTATLYRSRWAQLETERQLAVALNQTPANAGPLNSHRLALQTLQTLQQLSPAYLQRFLCQIDGLDWLTRTDLIPRASAGPVQGATVPTREKPRRAPPAKKR